MEDSNRLIKKKFYVGQINFLRVLMTADKKHGMQELIREAGLITLGAVSLAEDEIEKLIRKWTDSRGATREEAGNVLKEVIDLAGKGVSMIDKAIDEGISYTIHSIVMPQKDKLSVVARKVDKLEKRIAVLGKSESGKNGRK
ncbi:hypothetical protein ACFL4G_10725 [Thermodesulfobacteriota bacterium]